ncbi:MAG: DUF2270 domain-containing protein [Pyrinomonadaceae bacterium]
MKDEVRLGSPSVGQAVDDDIHTTNVPEAFRSFAEEVRRRNQKAKSTPLTIAQKLQPAEFNTAMVHFYRGEVQRSNTWRNRLDTTTNWAVITAGATLSFVFSSPGNPHFAIPINTLLVATFLMMEARRYRYYEVWANRVRVVETGYFAPMLSQRTVPPDQEWAEHISADLVSPHFTISEWEAVGRRLRANYLWIFLLLSLSWMLKLYIHPEPAADVAEFVQRAKIGLLPGPVVFAGLIGFNMAMFFIAMTTRKLNQSSSEVLPMADFEWHPFKQVSDWAESSLKRRSTIRRSKKARNRLRAIHKTEA